MFIGLVVRAWCELVYVDFVGLRGLRALRHSVGPRVTPPSRQPDVTVPPIVGAVTTAIAYYVKPVLCLQHAVAVTRMLRRSGVDAELVIGAHPVPFRAHAWVEVAGSVVAVAGMHQEYLNVLDRW